jgi:hypothetical protein
LTFWKNNRRFQKNAKLLGYSHIHGLNFVTPSVGILGSRVRSQQPPDNPRVMVTAKIRTRISAAPGA